MEMLARIYGQRGERAYDVTTPIMKQHSGVIMEQIEGRIEDLKQRRQTGKRWAIPKRSRRMQRM